jgi:outer membrane protein assembly factor BamD
MSLRWLTSIVLVCLAAVPDAWGRVPPESPFYEEAGKGRSLKNLFKAKTKPPAAEEDIYAMARSYYEGRPTWLGKKYPEQAEKYRNNKWYRAYYFRIDYQKCIELFQKLVYEYPFTRHLADADYFIAESHFKLKEYEVALQAYQDFLVRHPKDPRVEYVYYQIGLCHWNSRIKNPLRDQTETEAAVAAFKTLLTIFPSGQYADKARNYVKLGNQSLSERELKVGDFYFKRKEFWSASLRYHYAWVEFPEATKADYARYREALCLEKMGRSDDAAKSYQGLLDSYPESSYRKEAQKYLENAKKPVKKVEQSPK